MYLDYFVLHLSSYRDHVKDVLLVLFILRLSPGVSLVLEKHNFYTGIIDYLGQVKEPRRPEIATHVTDLFKQLKSLPNTTGVCSFFRLCEMFRCFVCNFKYIAAMLKEKLQNIRRHILDIYHQKSWRQCLNCRTNWWHWWYSRYHPSKAATT